MTEKIHADKTKIGAFLGIKTYQVRYLAEINKTPHIYKKIRRQAEQVYILDEETLNRWGRHYDIPITWREFDEQYKGEAIPPPGMEAGAKPRPPTKAERLRAEVAHLRITRDRLTEELRAAQDALKDEREAMLRERAERQKMHATQIMELRRGYEAELAQANASIWERVKGHFW